FYKCTETMIKVANILRKENDAAKFNKLAASIKEAFICKFYDSKKNSFKTQGADGVALRYGLYPTGCAELLALDYKRILEKDGYSMYTGIYANKHSIPAMTEYGYGSEMLSALISPENNNFRKMIESGATSLYECFVSPQEESNPASLNHPMQGAFTSWFYTHILGIRASENNPGYKEIIVRPYVFDGIENASGHYDTVYGRVSVSWSLKDNMFTLDVTLPANTYGKIEIPAVNGFEFDSIRCIDSSGDTLSPVFHGEISSIAVTNGKYVVTANT
ncbi:MAG: hypothetical protein IJZ90_00890, partial [Clostridia bacterium]|nr:hypothetical protein [Clostridia bacterium]